MGRVPRTAATERFSRFQTDPLPLAYAIGDLADVRPASPGARGAADDAHAAHAQSADADESAALTLRQNLEFFDASQQQIEACDHAIEAHVRALNAQLATPGPCPIAHPSQAVPP